MKTIDLELWGPKEDDPRYAERKGQRSAEEVFNELKQRLDGMGMLPDEYFLLDSEWKNGKYIPVEADIFVTTDYGESEGVYLDGYLKWYEDGKPISKSFFTGKTLGQTGADLDRMFLISSAITKAFHGDGGQYARFSKLGPQEKVGDTILNLTPKEQRVFIDALMRQREQALETADSTEKLLRRMTGSITAYMDTVGERPLHISDHDKASMAIHDGELAAFKELLHKCNDTLNTLLIEASGRAGEIGRKMTVEIVAAADLFSMDSYATAGRNAVKIGDLERVKFLMEQAETKVKVLDTSFYGKIIQEAHWHNRRMEDALIEWSPAEWITAVKPELLISAIEDRAYHRIGTLLKKGIETANYAADILYAAYKNDGHYLAEFLLDCGMKVSPGNFYALDLCVKNCDAKTGCRLLDQGMDFEKYLRWSEARGEGNSYGPEKLELNAHWQNLHPQDSAPEDAPDEVPQINRMTI